jgi:signal transduction histidine kinase
MDMRVKNFTPAAGAVFRLIAGDIGRPITDLAARFSDGNFEQDIHQVLRTLEVVERQLSAPADHFYQMRILPYRTLNNVVEGVVVTFLDVTPLKKAEQQARHSQLYAESIVEAVRVPLMVLTPDLRVVSANKAFYEMFRVSEHSTAGKPLYELGNGQWDTPELRRLMTQVLPNGPVKNYQFEGIVPDLGKRTMLLNAHQIDAQNEWAGLILVSIDDITESREELLRLNADLKHISYATSHDLHEPLRMVISYTQLLAREYRDKLDPQANQFMGYAIQGAERMEMLLKNLREYWTINEQQREMNSRVNCEVVFDQAVRDLDRVVEESDARITHDRLPMVRTEEVSLSLLLQNLLSNAIKYRRAEEPPQVHMRARPENAFWHFELSDNGIGIDPQYLETIFAPFKRLHGRDVYAGSGLGLAISKKIVERAGGGIWAESSQQCTTFHFTLPKKDGDG